MVKRERKTYSDITGGKIGQSLWRLSLPSMLGALLLNLFSLVDLFFIGRLGYVAVAALSIFKGCSRAIAAYPNINTTTININILK